ncbi:ATP-dependent RNA helicase DeaD [Dongia mobilis]|uniref:ATP-dependent RNA helicase DeaD n=1 Tax=Dongia mobilis TaxID=578943 RepID=A0A4R6WJD4_9PROT|nr:DEAD/DEAH box helicase [Dongia mobilis]TDQ78784.1 ATP-dependent RNA helicase DeaD [Dongia mobilis]
MPFPTSHPALERALSARAYLEPTPVQAAVLAADAAERDLLVSAQTGSGKTVAFGLAMASTLLGDAERFERRAQPLALIVAPTRELAMQVHAELSWLYAEAGARVVACVGGMDARREARALGDGAHIVVGTPGRLRDHLERGNLETADLRVIVLDEADEMLDLGFREDLEFILDATPESRRTLLFSATIARDIAELARTYQKDALRIDTLVKNQAHGDIEYHALRVAPIDVTHAIVNLLRYHEAKAALVFCHTREAVRHLHANLSERGFSAVALSGELSQAERSHALQALRDGRARVCVATDVAARGLDLPELGLVIHADLPRDKATLLHRSGRTGRAGRKGISALMVPYNRRRKVEELLGNANIKAIWQDPPKAEAVRQRDQERLLSDPLLTEAAAPEDLELAKALLAERSAEDVAAAFIRFHRARLPAPEEIIDRPQPSRDARGEAREPRAFEKRDADRAPRPAFGESVWFDMNIGRSNQADPKWLIPLICRRGHITKNEIGYIKIDPDTTRFEIAAGAAEKFAAAIAKAPNDEIAIAPAGGAMPRRPHAPRDDRPKRASFKTKESPHRERGPSERAFGERKYNERKFGERSAGDASSRKTPERAEFAPRRDREAGDRPFGSKAAKAHFNSTEKRERKKTKDKKPNKDKGKRRKPTNAAHA